MKDNTRIWLGTGLVLFVILALVVLAVWRLTPSLFRPVKRVSLHRIEELTEVTFPSTTKLLGSCFVGGQGWELRAKLVMNKSSVQRFVDSIPSSHRISRTDRFGISNSMADYSHSQIAWWDPDSAASFTAISARYPPKANVFKEIQILIVDNGPRRSVVYMFSTASW